MPIPDGSKRYTYKDWMEWDGRWELIQGKAFNIAPAPSSNHQFIVGELFHSLRLYFENKECYVMVSPFDVFLSDNSDYDSINHVVQPDISVIGNNKQITRMGCNGAPALIIEVLSSSTALKDYNEKFNIYQQSGVKEYWIVDSTNKIIHVHRRKDGYFSKRITFGAENTLKSFLYDDLTIDLKEVFNM